MPTTKQDIGETIRLLLRTRHVTIQTLADALGISRQQVHARLRGEANIAAHELVIIADLLDVEPGVLFVSAGDLQRRLTGEVPEGQNWKLLDRLAAKVTERHQRLADVA